MLVIKQYQTFCPTSFQKFLKNYLVFQITNAADKRQQLWEFMLFQYTLPQTTYIILSFSENTALQKKGFCHLSLFNTSVTELLRRMKTLNTDKIHSTCQIQTNIVILLFTCCLRSSLDFQWFPQHCSQTRGTSKGLII